MATLKSKTPKGPCRTAHGPAGFNTIPVWMLPWLQQTSLSTLKSRWAMHPTSSDHTELSLRPTSQTHPSRLTSSRTILHLSHTSSHNSDFVEPETDK